MCGRHTTRYIKREMSKIPFVDLKAGFETIKSEVMAALENVLAGMNLNLGPNVQALEDEFAAYCGTKYAVGVGSGTEALHLSLRACGIKAGDEVITSAHTFFATAEAISYTGAKPVFADIDPNIFTINPSSIQQKITKKTKAIIPVHMYGQSADMASIMEIAKCYGLKVIEDSCQAHGATYKGTKCGSIGDAGCFSFYFTKNLGGCGEGGMVITNDPDIKEKLILLRNHGHKSKYEHSVIGYNSRLDEIQAAILRIKLKHLDDNNNARRSVADTYNSLLNGKRLILPKETDGCRHVYHLYVIRCQEREALQQYLAESQIGTGIHYKNPVHLQEPFKHYGYKRGDLPVTEGICEEILSLPIYPELKTADIEYITNKVTEFLHRK